MKSRKILVIGGTAAGPSAAAKARRVNPSAEVTLFEASETVSYGICEAPYVLSGVIADEGKLVSYTPERLSGEKGVVVKTGHIVEKILNEKKRLLVKILKTNATEEYEYTQLIIATGSSPRRLNLEGEDARNVFRLWRRDDTRDMLRFLQTESPARAVVIGGGYVGMEVCDALRSRGIEVTLLHRHRLPMAGLEQETREAVLRVLESNGVHFVSNARVEALHAEGARVRHVITNRGTFPCDLVFLSLGVTPNAGLAKRAGIRLGATGAISVDERQQTSADGIFAAGDCCEVKNAVTGRPMYLPLATLANRGGRIAGENAAGGRAYLKGVIRAIAVKIFDAEFAHVGLGSDEAKEAGFAASTVTVTAHGSVGIMPRSETTTMCVVFDAGSGRLLGANVFGGAGSVLRANTLGVAIQQRLTLEDVARFDLIYSPPFAPLWDPILVAAHAALKKQRHQ